jgi:hypothetical protein
MKGDALEGPRPKPRPLSPEPIFQIHVGALNPGYPLGAYGEPPFPFCSVGGTMNGEGSAGPPNSPVKLALERGTFDERVSRLVKHWSKHGSSW